MKRRPNFEEMIMDEIRFLLKFGKKKHIEEFVDGSLFCSNAETFWGIEKDKKIKGQGTVQDSGRIKEEIFP